MLGICAALPLLCVFADPSVLADPAATVTASAFPIPGKVGVGADPATGQSRAVRVNHGALIHTGQLFPAGPQFSPTSPHDQVLQVFAELQIALQRANANLGDVVKLNVYVAHPSLTALIDQQLKRSFSTGVPPAVSWVQTAMAESATMVALDAVARVDVAAAKTVTLVDADHSRGYARAAILPQGPTAYISGQAEAGDRTVKEATRQTMASLLRTLEFLKTSSDQVVQVKAFLTPISDARIALQEIQAAFAGKPCPPVTFVEWDSQLPIEIEMIAATPVPPADSDRSLPPAVSYLTPPGMTTPTVYCRVAQTHSPARIYTGGLMAQTAEPNTEAEAVELFEALKDVIDDAGGDLLHLVKGTYYVSHPEANRWITAVRPRYFQPSAPPAASKANVAGTGRPPRQLTLDMIAVPKS